MPSLFDPVHAGALVLRSRIVMAPLTRNRAPGAMPNTRMATYYRQRACPDTGAGLIITEATAISPQGQGYADVPGLWNDEQVRAWRVVTDAVHAEGGSIVVQLWHVGRVSHTSLQPGGAAPVAPSALTAQTKTVLLVDGQPQFVETSAPRALQIEEIPGIVQDYRQAAARAMAAGFDGVEVHAANGYLIDQFLRAGSNRRTDDYGGPVAHRARFVQEVMQAVTDEIGGARTGIRLSPVTPSNDASDDAPQALFEHVVRALGPLGLAYVHLIEGATGGARTHQQGPAPFDYTALRQAWRGAGGRGAWMVNNGYDLALAASALAEGADLIAFGRPFIANPDLGARLRQGGPFNTPERKTFYGGGDEGYLDYPTLA
jgi:N-ethylmaleimide reductase